MSEDTKRKIPMLTVILLLLISSLFLIRGGVKLFYLFFTPLDEDMYVSFLIGDAGERSFIELFLSVFILSATWLLSTKVIRFQTLSWRLTFFLVMVVGILLQLVWNATAPIYSRLLPSLLGDIDTFDIPRHTMLTKVFLEGTKNVEYLILIIPSITVFLIVLYLSRLYTTHPEVTREYFQTWEYPNRHLQRFFRWQHKLIWPDIPIGPDSETGELVYQKGKDRSLHNLIVGNVGTGKTASLILPKINEDLHHMTRFINLFEELYEKDDYHTEDVKGKYLNGLTIIEPSNDLCQKAYELVKAHNIPEESVFYIDPTNPNTKSINLMRGPVDKVAEVFTSVVEGLAANQDYFFAQSQRVHLKNYIYLLKLHEEDGDPTLNELIDMYNDAQLVRKMHMKLKDTIPDNYKEIEDRDERNHWEIVKGIDAWFDSSIIPLRERRGPIEVPVYITDEKSPYFNEPAYIDAKSEYVVGLRNILDDIAANKLLRRVLFGKSDFDFDKHLELGGILLVNTSKGELMSLSNVFGKMVLLSMQNAVFRRPPNVSTFHHLYVDEFPDYIYENFREFPAQSRKYKTITTVATQSISQLAHQFGNTFMETLLGTFRHLFVFGDVSNMDATYFSEKFGTHEVYKETSGDTSIGPLQDNTMRRVTTSFSKVEEPIMSPSEIIYQEPFQCAYKLVLDNKPTKVRQLKANFLPKKAFIKANVTVETEAAAYWLNIREAQLMDNYQFVEVGVEEEEMTNTEFVGGVAGSIETSEQTGYEARVRSSYEKQPLSYNVTRLEKEAAGEDEQMDRSQHEDDVIVDQTLLGSSPNGEEDVELVELDTPEPHEQQQQEKELEIEESAEEVVAQEQDVKTDSQDDFETIAAVDVLSSIFGHEDKQGTSVESKPTDDLDTNQAPVKSPLNEDAIHLFSSLNRVVEEENRK